MSQPLPIDDMGRPIAQIRMWELWFPRPSTNEFVHVIICGCNLQMTSWYDAGFAERAKRNATAAKWLEDAKALRRRSFKALAHDPGCECFV